MQDITWIDRTAYPFQSNYVDIDGARLHYVDEGEGSPLLMVHGTTTWSFLYRNIVKALSTQYRCIALDHLGFGLSDKPEQAAYRTQDHARRLHALIEYLDLKDITLAVHDFGGPIGLSYAIERPENIRSLVIFNTWMWSLRGRLIPEMGARVGGRMLGRLFVKRLNLEMHGLFRVVWGDWSKLTPQLHKQYLGPFPTFEDRESMRVLAGELVDASTWFDGLWNRRERIRSIPTLIMWGMKDLVVRPRDLARWEEVFDKVEIVRYPQAGHFVQEEASERIIEVLETFLKKR